MASKRALLMDQGDNCVVALEHIEPGDHVQYECGELTALDAVDLGHKLAIAPIAPGDKVIKHRAPIGSATQAIAPGAHIHTHNLKSDYIFGFHRED